MTRTNLTVNVQTSPGIIENVGLIWEHLNVLPNVREHQARVAGIICVLRDNWKPNGIEVDWDDAIAAALMHDVGNIAKADLTTIFSQQLLGPLECERIDFWLQTQAELRARFGNDEYKITCGLMRSISLPERLITLITSAGFSNNQETLASKDWERKLLAQADHCVGPFSVLTLHERLSEGAKRYGYPDSSSDMSSAVRAAYDLSAQVQQQVSLPLDDITDELVNPYVRRFLAREE